MTVFTHTADHELNCVCSYCQDVDPTKSISRELEKYCEELLRFAFAELTDDQSLFVYDITGKILTLSQYFPVKELPSKHKRFVEALSEKND